MMTNSPPAYPLWDRVALELATRLTAAAYSRAS